LAAVPAGKVGAIEPVEQLLVEAWDELTGSDQGGMEAYKLIGRIEKMDWNSPLLIFEIERHGAAALASVRAEIQGWRIDTANGTASMFHAGLRQVSPRDPNWDAKAEAKKIAGLIITYQEDDRLVWNEKGQVRPIIGNIVPGSNRQTIEERSRRFWDALIAELLPHSWIKIGRHLEKRE
jgi:hypothetical protein